MAAIPVDIARLIGKMNRGLETAHVTFVRQALRLVIGNVDTDVLENFDDQRIK